MSPDLGRDVPDLEKLYARKLWADFLYPSFVWDCGLPLCSAFLLSSQKQLISFAGPGRF